MKTLILIAFFLGGCANMTPEQIAAWSKTTRQVSGDARGVYKDWRPLLVNEK